MLAAFRTSREGTRLPRLRSSTEPNQKEFSRESSAKCAICSNGRVLIPEEEYVVDQSL